MATVSVKVNGVEVSVERKSVSEEGPLWYVGGAGYINVGDALIAAYHEAVGQDVGTRLDNEEKVRRQAPDLVPMRKLNYHRYVRSAGSDVVHLAVAEEGYVRTSCGKSYKLSVGDPEIARADGGKRVEVFTKRPYGRLCKRCSS